MLRPDKQLPWLALQHAISPTLEQLQSLAELAETTLRSILGTGGKPECRPPGEILRIGYLGAEAESWRLQVIGCHNPDRVAPVVFLPYGAEPDCQLPSHVEICRFDPAEPDSLARGVRLAGLDLLVDCLAYARADIPPVLAMRLVPHQVAWGYPAPTGGLHDHHLFDRLEATPAMQPYFKARLVFLPAAHLVGPPATPEPVPRDRLGLPADRFLMVNAAESALAVKAMLPIWSRILGQIDQAALWLPCLAEEERRDVIKHSRCFGIPAEAILFAALSAPADLATADIYLDSRTTDAVFWLGRALENGLPAVTLLGDTPADRRGASALAAAGMGELAASSPDDYVAIAADLCRRPRRIAVLKNRLGTARGKFQAQCQAIAQAIENLATRAPGPLPRLEAGQSDVLFTTAFERHSSHPAPEVMALLDHALAAGCDRPDAWNLYGALLRRQGQAAAAVLAFGTALRHIPSFSDAWMNLGNAYRDLLRIDDAIAAYRKAIELRPDSSASFLNLGSCLNAHGFPAEALHAIDQALALDPDNADLHWDRALALLMLGKTREAWPDFEWRHRRQQPPKREYPQPEWHGQPLAGKRLLVYWEQGYGDTLQFLRFVPPLARYGGKVILHVQPGLGRLLGNYPGIDVIVDGESPLPEFDFHIPLLSLPRLLDIGPDDLNPMPLLAPPAPLVEQFKARIPATGRPRIGLAWAGNPNVKNDLIRSPRLQPLLPLLGITNADWYLLQKGDGRRDLEGWQLPDNVADLAACIEDFADTAAAMAHLDLVITSDTSTAHLALTLGKPTWILLHHGSDWRWGLGDRSIWYPGARLFRQAILEDWQPVVASVCQALAAEILTGTIERQALAPSRRGSAVPPPQRTGSADELFAQAIRCLQQNDQESALNACRQGLDIAPERADGWNLMGVIHKRYGRFEDAQFAYRQATHFYPAFADAWQNLGNLYRGWGKTEDAEQAFAKAVELSPSHAAAWSQLSDIYRSQGKLDLAVKCGKNATEHGPRLAEAWNHLGNAYNDLEDFAAAIPAYQAALAAQGDLHEARYNLGVAYQRQQKLEQAAACYLATLEARPDDARCHYNLGTTYLTMGRFREGFAEYEWRFQRGDDLRRRLYPQPEWKGESIAGKTLLVYWEQGYGDTMQFLRFVPLLAKSGARLILEVQTGLRLLAASLAGVVQVVEAGEHLPAFDLHVPLISLPHLLGIDGDTLPRELPYLAVPADRIEHWSPAVRQNGRVRVGLIWAGNPKVGNDRVRSPRLQPLQPLFALPGVDWYVLQQGDGRRDLENIELSDNVHDVAGEISSFTDSAAVMRHLDLVISSDTSTAHLAPAVGTATWVLLHHSADWRWGIGGQTPWYPGVRLFRQPAAGDWATPVAQIRQALETLVEKRSNTLHTA